MASGIIWGECAICGDLVWEDEWSLDQNDRVIHPRCRSGRTRAIGAVQLTAESWRLVESWYLHLQASDKATPIDENLMDLIHKQLNEN